MKVSKYEMYVLSAMRDNGTYNLNDPLPDYDTFDPLPTMNRLDASLMFLRARGVLPMDFRLELDDGDGS